MLKQLETVVTEIKVILNDRPLTYISSDVTDPVPLTPSHLLYGRRVQPIPCPLDNPADLDDADFAVSETMIRRQWTENRSYFSSFGCVGRVSTSPPSKNFIKQQDIIRQSSKEEMSLLYMMINYDLTGDWRW